MSHTLNEELRSQPRENEIVTKKRGRRSDYVDSLGYVRFWLLTAACMKWLPCGILRQLVW